MSENRLLIITSNLETAAAVQKVAEKHDYSVLKVNTVENIQSNCVSFKPNLIILDLHFSGMDGISLLNYLANIQCKIQIIMFGVEDEKLILSIKHIGEAKGLKLLKVLGNPQEEDLDRSFACIEKDATAVVDARQIVRALEEDLFVMHYQPKIELRTKRLWGFEALIRLQLGQKNLIFPDDFITTTEQTGLIEPLTHWIVRKVLENYRGFAEQSHALKFSINLSSKSLSDPVFPDEMLKITNSFNIDPRNVCFEITESGVSHQSEIILEVLTRLRVMGFALSIDDFGTGYSSIVELQRLPFTELKIDKRFVYDLIDNSATAIIVRSIIDLGHNLGLELVAEGVEDKETLENLQQLGCDIAQGYYIAKPFAMNELQTWFAEHIDADLIWHESK